MNAGVEKSCSSSFVVEGMHTCVTSTRFRLYVLCSSVTEMIRFSEENPWRENTMHFGTMEMTSKRGDDRADGSGGFLKMNSFNSPATARHSRVFFTSTVSSYCGIT